MNFDYTEEQQLLLDNLRRRMDAKATPEYIREHDENGLYPLPLTKSTTPGSRWA